MSRIAQQARNHNGERRAAPGRPTICCEAGTLKLPERSLSTSGMRPSVMPRLVRRLMSARVEPDQRFTKAHPYPVCSSHDSAPRGQNISGRGALNGFEHDNVQAVLEAASELALHPRPAP